MSWQGIHGHDDIAKRFAASAAVGRLAAAYLFVGPPGVGKFTLAKTLAKTLLCGARQNAEAASGSADDLKLFAPCGNCNDCRLVETGSHPDWLTIARPEGKSVIPVELLIGAGEKRMRQGLLHDLSLKPFHGRWKVAIIDDADYLAEEGANALLKTLEEPPPKSLLILVGTSAEKQLPTIRSRCQLVRFSPLDDETLVRLVVDLGIAADEAAARTLAAFAEGSLTAAAHLADADVLGYRTRLLEILSAANFDPNELVEATATFVEAAGADAPPRRDRARAAFGFAVDFWRQLARAACGSPTACDVALQRAVQKRQAGGVDPLATGRQIERTLDAIEDIDRNTHPAAVIDAWADEVWRKR